MDTISNMINQLKNAGNAGHDRVTLSHSGMKEDIAKVLKKEKFVKDFEVQTKDGKKKNLIIDLFSENRKPKIKGVSRISKPSKRIYKKVTEIRSVKNGYGALILSTSHGVMTGREAKEAKLGGEALFSIW